MRISAVVDFVIRPLCCCHYSHIRSKNIRANAAAATRVQVSRGPFGCRLHAMLPSSLTQTEQVHVLHVLLCTFHLHLVLRFHSRARARARYKMLLFQIIRRSSIRALWQLRSHNSISDEDPCTVAIAVVFAAGDRSLCDNM